MVMDTIAWVIVPLIVVIVCIIFNVDDKRDTCKSLLEHLIKQKVKDVYIGRLPMLFYIDDELLTIKAKKILKTIQIKITIDEMENYHIWFNLRVGMFPTKWKEVTVGDINNLEKAEMLVSKVVEFLKYVVERPSPSSTVIRTYKV